MKAMTSGSFSSPLMAIAGSPGRSCWSAKMIIDARITVGTMVSRRRSRKRSMEVGPASSVELEPGEPDEAVGIVAEPFQPRRIGPQQLAVVEVDHRPVGQDLRGEILPRGLALVDVVGQPRRLQRRHGLVVAVAGVVERCLAGE